jgi:hypothetical protein
MSKMDRLNARLTVIHSILYLFLKVYRWLARERVIVSHGRGDSDVES